MATNSLSPVGSLIVFCWGGPQRVAEQVARFGVNFARVVIIDPLPPVADGFPGAWKRHPGFESHKGIAGQESETVELIRHSLPGLYSRAPATDALKTLFPGLSEREHIRLASLKTSEITAVLGSLPDPLHVIIDTPGNEAQTLDMLAEAGLLNRTAAVHIRCGADAFFVQAKAAEIITQNLAAAGFTVSESYENDPDWPEALFCADPVARRVHALEAELDEARSDATRRLTAAKRELEAQLQATVQTEAAATLLKAELTTVQSDVERISQIKATLEQEKGEAVEALRQRDEQLAATQQQVERINQTKATLKQEKHETIEALRLRDEQLAATQQQLEQVTHSVATLEQEKGGTIETLRLRDEQLAATQQQLEQVNHSKTEATLLKAQLEMQLETVAQHEAEASLLDEQLTAAKRDLERINQSTVTLTKENSKVTETLRVRDAELEREERAHTDTKKRLLAARDEIRRAEGQIALIQDLLLRQPEL